MNPFPKVFFSRLLLSVLIGQLEIATSWVWSSDVIETSLPPNLPLGLVGGLKPHQESGWVALNGELHHPPAHGIWPGKEALANSLARCVNEAVKGVIKSANEDPPLGQIFCQEIRKTLI